MAVDNLATIWRAVLLVVVISRWSILVLREVSVTRHHSFAVGEGSRLGAGKSLNDGGH